MTDKQVAWGIVGPGAIAHNFAKGLAAAASAQLVAVYGRTARRREAFATAYGIDANQSYGELDALLADAQVDAVYIATTHPSHAQLSIAALRAGKHVVCEKPAAVNEAQMRAVVHAAAEARRFFMEGFMYLCHPQIARLVALLREGRIGTIEHVDATFAFDAPFAADSRLYDPAQAGGGILDVGCYAVSFARLVAGVANDVSFADPTNVAATAQLAPSGVDQAAFAMLEFDRGVTAACLCGVSGRELTRARITGSSGTIELEEPFVPGRDDGPADAKIVLEVDGERSVEQLSYDQILFAAEAQLASAAILDGRLEAPAPAMSWQGSIGNARTLERWRDAVGYALPAEGPAAAPLRGVIAAAARMPRRQVAGLAKAVSKLVLGCDNQQRYSDAATIWDAWFEAGGNAFDTAFIYGNGAIERMLGRWLTARGARDEAVLVCKGCHTPWCDPAVLELQLQMSLERLQTDSCEFYLLHRDDPAIPVGEFIDALDAVADAGKVALLGASNWTLGRFVEANEWATANGKRPLAVLNNNLALATMVKPPWAGCHGSNDPQTLAHLRAHDVVHLSWSSQARGYFLAPDQRSALDADSGPEACFGGSANELRRARATELAAEKGVLPTNVAAAWVLQQSFPSFALIGPRTPAELASSLPATALSLSAAECAWLNLEADGR